MARLIGVMAAEHIAAGAVEGNRVVGQLRTLADVIDDLEGLATMPPDQIAKAVAFLVESVAAGGDVAAVGLGFPGVIWNGVVDDSPNLPQTKGHNIAEAVREALAEREIITPVHVLNDADATAAGVAAEFGLLDQLVRVWTLGVGVGYGRYPQSGGPCEGGHMVVSLDPRETYCGCGGIGHLEGILGHRAMRSRFLDMEPDEVFDRALLGEARFKDFVETWHRALASATASLVAIDGPGRFFVSGPNARLVNVELLGEVVREMVRMQPLRGTTIELVTTSDAVGVVGAAVSAERVLVQGLTPPSL